LPAGKRAIGSRWFLKVKRNANGSLDCYKGKVSTKKKKRPEIRLKRNKHGHPILPSLEEINHHDLLYKKQLIGKFMTDAYGL
jgi:hypothetical protein